VPVIAAQAQRADLPFYLSGIGTAAAFNTVTVRTRIDGQLTSVAFKEGQFVHQGDLLAQIDSRPYEVQLEQAEGQYARDKAQLDEARLNYDRNVRLGQQGIIPQQQVDTQQSQVNQFVGAMKADQGQIDNAKLQITYCKILAPISGQIGLRLVDVGNMVHANDQNGLLVITQLQPISVLFSLPQDNLPQVFKAFRGGTPLTVDAYDRDNLTKIATGTLATIDNQIDVNTGTYKLKAVFSNEDGALFPNQFVNVRLLLETRHGLTVVPTPAIQRGPQGNFVYVVTDKKSVAVRPVKVEMTEGNSTGLSDGVQPGETVVIDGQDRLQEGMRVEVRAPGGGDNGAAAGGGGRNDKQASAGDQRGEAGRRRGGKSE
jgi:multidrug efflux system membrane fusion protein